MTTLLGLPSQEGSMLLETLKNQKASEIRIVPLDLLYTINVTASPGKHIVMIKRPRPCHHREIPRGLYLRF